MALISFKSVLIHGADNEKSIDEPGVVQQPLADLLFQQCISQDGVLGAGFQCSRQALYPLPLSGA